MCVIKSPKDSSPSLSYIWSWIFPFTVLYMILIFPRHCLIYDPDSSPSLLYMILNLHKIVYQYCNVFHHFCIVMEVYLRMCVIKSPKFLIVFFIIIILILFLLSFRGQTACSLFAAYNCYSYYAQPYLIYDPDSSPSLSYIYDSDSSPSLSYIWSWIFPITVLYMILILKSFGSIHFGDHNTGIKLYTSIVTFFIISVL
jgi:hypothetical protein